MVEKVQSFLKDNAVCTVATSLNDVPRASTVDYIMVDGNLVFATGSDTRKAKNLAGNNKASITILSTSVPQHGTFDGTVTAATEAEVNAYNNFYSTRNQIEKSTIPTDFVYYRFVPKTVHYNDHTAGASQTEVLEY